MDLHFHPLVIMQAQNFLQSWLSISKWVVDIHHQHIFIVTHLALSSNKSAVLSFFILHHKIKHMDDILLSDDCWGAPYAVHIFTRFFTKPEFSLPLYNTWICWCILSPCLLHISTNLLEILAWSTLSPLGTHFLSNFTNCLGIITFPTTPWIQS